MPSNDDTSAKSNFPAGTGDPHGRAALLVVESLIHILMERGSLTIGEAVEVIETARDVQADIAEAVEDPSASMWRSHALLARMSESLRSNLAGSGGPRPS